MALVTCKECSREISDRAARCPHCGAPGPATTLILGGGGPLPEGIELASWGSRVGAYILDGIILIIPFFVIVFGVFAAAASDSPEAGLGLIPLFFAWILASLLYKPLMEGAKGQTLGKMAVKIKVINADTGEQCDYGKAFLRWLVGAGVNIIPLGGLVDVLWPLWDPRNQAIHDKIGTLVVRA